MTVFRARPPLAQARFSEPACFTGTLTPPQAAMADDKEDNRDSHDKRLGGLRAKKEQGEQESAGARRRDEKETAGTSSEEEIYDPYTIVFKTRFDGR